MQMCVYVFADVVLRVSQAGLMDRYSGGKASAGSGMVFLGLSTTDPPQVSMSSHGVWNMVMFW